MPLELQLLSLIQYIGEGVHGAIQIVDLDGGVLEPAFRVYHADGFCWVSKIVIDEETGEADCFFIEGFEGFDESGIDFAITEILKVL